jgi:hypothetical protein
LLDQFNHPFSDSQFRSTPKSPPLTGHLDERQFVLFLSPAKTQRFLNVKFARSLSEQEISNFQLLLTEQGSWEWFHRYRWEPASQPRLSGANRRLKS